MRKLITYKTLAEMLGMPVGTLHAKVSRREIPHIRLGRRLVRFDVEAIEAWLKACDVSATKNDNMGTHDTT